MWCVSFFLSTANRLLWIMCALQDECEPSPPEQGNLVTQAILYHIVSTGTFFVIKVLKYHGPQGYNTGPRATNT